MSTRSGWMPEVLHQEGSVISQTSIMSQGGDTGGHKQQNYRQKDMIQKIMDEKDQIRK